MTGVISVRPGWAVKAIIVVIFTSMLFRCVSATNHSVGGASGWDLSSNLQAWATHATFRAGDSLVFRYTPVHDVLEVNKMEYDLCHTVDPMETHNDGETVIPLREAGNRYFICGRLGHCAMGLKLHVQVVPAQRMTISPGTTSSTNTNATSPSSASPFTNTTTSGHESDHPNTNNRHGPTASPPLSPSPVFNHSNSTDHDAAGSNTSSTTTSDARLIVESKWVHPVVATVAALLIMHGRSPSQVVLMSLIFGTAVSSDS